MLKHRPDPMSPFVPLQHAKHLHRGVTRTCERFWYSYAAGRTMLDRFRHCGDGLIQGGDHALT